VLKHFTVNRKRRLAALLKVVYVYTTLELPSFQEPPYIYDISRIRVNDDWRSLFFLLEMGRDQNNLFPVAHSGRAPKTLSPCLMPH
jgi:hypothetical protein